MNYLYCLKSGEAINLLRDDLLKDNVGGEGSIFRTNKIGCVAKIYHSKNDIEKFNKLKVMLENPPSAPDQAKNHISIAWPIDILIDQEQNFAGFLMPEVIGSKPLVNVYNPKLRGKEASGCNWKHLHAIAQNTATIVESLHLRNYVIGDLKPENLIVNDRVLVSIVDTDSFTVKDKATGKIYRSSVGSPEYTPPEMYGKDFSKVDRSEVQDRFGLAVIIWLLLFGQHPFSGKWTGFGNDQRIDENIRAGYWVYGNNSQLKPANRSISIEVLPSKLQQLFYRCFSEGHSNPSARPSSSEWSQALQTARQDLQACENNPAHYYSNEYGKCHWCEINELYNYEIFSANSQTVERKSVTQPTITTPNTQKLANPASTGNQASSFVAKVAQAQASKSHTNTSKIYSTSKPTFSTSQSNNQASSQYPSVAPPKSQRKQTKGLGTFILFAICFLLFNPSYNFLRSVVSNYSQSTSQTSSNQHNNTDISLRDYPLESCGDSDPPGVDNWYPVFVKNDPGNLDRVKTRFCRDALPNRREELNRVDIQVASFRNKDRAEEFAFFMRSQLGSGEVGKLSRR